MRFYLLSYNKNNKQLARNLRNHSTLAEVLLWQKLKGKQLGVKFQRQKRIGNYIVDFFSGELMLTIEIDGISHDEKEKEDHARQQFIEKQGVSFLRFSDGEVKRDMDGVIRSIQNFIDKKESKLSS